MSTQKPDISAWQHAVKHPKRGVPEGLWMRCPGCEQTIFRKEAERRLGVCPECDYHWYVSAEERIRQLIDEGTFEEWDADLEPTDPLDFVDKSSSYADKLVKEQARTKLRDAAITGAGMIRGRPVAFRLVQPWTLAERMRAAGLGKVEYHRFTCGVATLYVGRKGERSEARDQRSANARSALCSLTSDR